VRGDNVTINILEIRARRVFDSFQIPMLKCAKILMVLPFCRLILYQYKSYR